MNIIDWLKENKYLSIIFIIASFMRFYQLDFQSVWCDEILTMIHTFPTFTMKQTYDSVLGLEYIPHLYFYSLKYFFFLTGYTIHSARLFSVLIGLFSIIVIYWLVKEMINKNAGLISGILLSVNLFHISYSQEARPYCLMVLFILLSYISFYAYLKEQNYKNAIILGLFTGLIPNAHLIGLLNTGAIYLTLLLLIIINTNKKLKITLFKYAFLSGFVSILILSLVYDIMTRTSNIESFWAPKPNFGNIKGVFLDIFGKSKILLFINFLICIIYFLHNIYILKKNNIYNKSTINFVVVSVWFFLNIGVIIFKSYLGSSLIVSRYFIGILPIFIIMTVYVLLLISNKIIRYVILFLLILLSLHNTFYVQKYYTTNSKTQFDPLINELVSKNKQDDIVVSEYGWLLSPYVDKSKIKNIETSTLDDYIISMKNKAVSTSSFWYFNGNNHPFNVKPETQDFLNENFVLNHDIKNYFDCWAKHYILKTEKAKIINETKNFADELDLYLNEFSNFINDGKGNLLIFENSTIISKEINLEKGLYKLIINGNSLPQNPIQNQNAKIILKIAGKEIANYYLSEDLNKKTKEFKFEIREKQKSNLELSFINDISSDGLDRNVIIYSAKIIRTEI